jgi:hypothetical protein
VDAVGPVGALGADTTARYEAALQDVSPASEDAGGYPPPEHCDMDASAEASVTACPPPLSACADGQRLKYFDWGQCVAGWCNWPETIMSCFPGCSNGACLSGPTMWSREPPSARRTLSPSFSMSGTSSVRALRQQIAPASASVSWTIAASGVLPPSVADRR